MKIKLLSISIIVMMLLSSCLKQNVREWSNQEIDAWLNESKWNSLGITIDLGTNKRSFVEQNVLNPESWKAVYEFYKGGCFNEKPLGRYNLDENGTYVNIEEYNTKDSSHFESHRDYIDIQFLSKGKEYVYKTSLNNIEKEVQPYNKEKDIEFFDKKEYTKHLLDGSNFLIIFPYEGHMPCMAIDTSQYVRKVVAKIPFVK